MTSPQPQTPFCGDDPNYTLAYGLPESIFDPAPILPCPPMPGGALGRELTVDPISVDDAATHLRTAATGLHWIADNNRGALSACLPDLGVMADPLQQGFGEALDAVRRLGDDVGRLANALADVLRAYAELDGAPLATGRAV